PRETFLAAAARDAGVRHHLVADRDPGDARADGVDYSRHVGAEDERVAQLEVGQPASHEHVESVERHGLHPQAHLARPRRRIRPPPEAQHLGPAVLAKNDRLHQLATSTARTSRITVTLIWPGNVISSEMRRAISVESSTARRSLTRSSLTCTRTS